MGGAVYFRARSLEHGYELWRKAGAGPATLVRDILPGSVSSSPSGLVVANNRLFFVAAGPEGGRELWSSDGTAGGTARVKDIWAGARGSRPQQLTALGSLVVFSAETSENEVPASSREPDCILLCLDSYMLFSS